MERCRFRGVNTHSTRDAITFTDAAAEKTALLLLRRGLNYTCRCSTGACSPEECDEAYVTDESGERLATLHGWNLRARALENGATAIYRAATKDQSRSHGEILRTLNRQAEKFWARPSEEQ